LSWAVAKVLGLLEKIIKSIGRLASERLRMVVLDRFLVVLDTFLFFAPSAIEAATYSLVPGFASEEGHPAEVGLQARGVDPLSSIRLTTWLGQPAQPMPHRVSTSAGLLFPHKTDLRAPISE
jgi:hypothetical protein